MKSLFSVLTFGLTIVAATTVQAQMYGGGYDELYYRPSTAAESYARGAADLTRAWGDYNANTAGAWNRAEEARRAFIQNQQQAIHAYFDTRAMNRQLRAAEIGPRKSPDWYASLAQRDVPARLSPGELDSISGRINWPILLRTQAGAAQRAEMERIFANRAIAGGLTAEEYLRVEQITQAMLDELKDQVAVLPPREYTVAKRFVQSLAYEATLRPA